MTKLSAKGFYESFIGSLSSSPAVEGLWRGTLDWKNPAWTSAVSNVLVDAAQAYVSSKCRTVQVCAKGRSDNYRRNEYMTLDVLAHDDSWGKPLMIIEHENQPWEKKLQYCAWKLLCVDAGLRVLVAYIDTTGRYPYCFQSKQDLLKAIAQVTACHPRKLAVIIGEWAAPLVRPTDWRSVYSLKILGSDP